VTSIAVSLEGELGAEPVLHLANRLRVARAEQRLSQEQLARMAGVTRQTISAIENGQYCPSALLAFVLAKQLEKPVAELFYLEDEKP
jgi:putative transcriptional regulator